MRSKIFLPIILFSFISQISLAGLPHAPVNFCITNTFRSAIILKWNYTWQNVDGFVIERSSDGINWNYLTSAPVDCSSFFDVGLIKYSRYYYRMYAFNKSGKSLYSELISGVTIPNDYCTVGTDTVSIAYPFFTTYSDSRTQFLYKKNEILPLGNCLINNTILEIGFNSTFASSNTINSCSIKIQNTTDSVLTGFKNSNWTTVYSGTIHFYFQGWNMINLSPSFTLDTTKNLLVEICFHLPINFTSNILLRSSSAPNKVWHRHSNTLNGCTLDSGASQIYRPNIKFYNFINTVIRTGETTPPKFELEQNYPNPFNGSTKFRFKLEKFSYATLCIYDVLGRQEIVVFNEPLEAGEYEKVFSLDKYPLPSGIYYFVLTTTDNVATKRLVILK